MTDKLLIDRTLLEQALDALLHRRSGSDQVQRIDAAITDLCAALAQQPEPAQEPIGWLNGDDEYADFMHRELARIHQQRGSSTPKFFTIPVYTKPFRSKPLTDEEIEDIWNRYCDELGEASINDAIDIARAIERKVRGETE